MCTESEERGKGVFYFHYKEFNCAIALRICIPTFNSVLNSGCMINFHIQYCCSFTYLIVQTSILEPMIQF